MSDYEKIMAAVASGEIPTVEYPKEYVDELNKEVEEAKAQIAKGELPIYDSVEELLAALGYDTDCNKIPSKK